MAPTKIRLATTLLMVVVLAACTSSPTDSTAESTATTPTTSKPTETTSASRAATPTSDPAASESTDAPANGSEQRTVDEQAAIDLAASLGLTRLSVWSPSTGSELQKVLAVDGDDASTIEIGESWAWADTEFIYTSIYHEDGPSSSSVLTYDGTTVCEVFGDIHHATRRPDGSIVAAVNTSDYSVENPEQTAVAFDCDTGDMQPIEAWIQRPVGDLLTSITERIAGRVFVFEFDVEGNADVTNEDGVSINGDDYAGWHTFNADGSIVVYGNASPLVHVSAALRARDTTTGSLLWEAELERPFISLTIVGDRLFIGLPEEKADGYYLDGTVAESIVVVDLETGDTLGEVRSNLQIIGAG